jgi:hypothetical protein
VDLSTKLPASGKVERLRQNESRGNCPLVVAADTGLTSGDGVTAAMIGGGGEDTARQFAGAGRCWRGGVEKVQPWVLGRRAAQRERTCETAAAAQTKEAREENGYIIYQLASAPVR